MTTPSTDEESDPSALRPCIAELLRTRHYPSRLLLRVDKILAENASTANDNDNENGTDKSPTRRRAYRLLLTDEELAIQAVLHRDFHLQVRSRRTVEGQLVVLHRYTLQRAPRLNGQGEVCYLAVDEFRNYGSGTAGGSRPVLGQALSESEEEAAERSSRVTSLLRKRGPVDHGPSEEERPEKRLKRQREVAGTVGDDSDSDAFETSALSQSAIIRRRGVLQSISGNGRLRWSVDNQELLIDGDGHDEDEGTGIDNSTVQLSLQQESSSKDAAAATTTTSDHPTIQLHTLASLLDPAKLLPPRNYICAVFAVITWVSAAILKRPGLPEKRHIKIHDSTIGRRYSGVSVSIFVDARHFRPRVGTVALFTGLTAQKWDGEVILTAYERDCKGREWYVDDEVRLEAEGYAVQELRRWWKERGQR